MARLPIRSRSTRNHQETQMKYRIIPLQPTTPANNKEDEIADAVWVDDYEKRWLICWGLALRLIVAISPNKYRQNALYRA